MGLLLAAGFETCNQRNVTGYKQINGRGLSPAGTSTLKRRSDEVTEEGAALTQRGLMCDEQCK